MSRTNRSVPPAVAGGCVLPHARARRKTDPPATAGGTDHYGGVCPLSRERRRRVVGVADLALALGLGRRRLFDADGDLALGELGGVGDERVGGLSVGLNLFERGAVADRGEHFEEARLRVAVDAAEEDVERVGAFELFEVRDGLLGLLLLV